MDAPAQRTEVGQPMMDPIRGARAIVTPRDHQLIANAPRKRVVAERDNPATPGTRARVMSYDVLSKMVAEPFGYEFAPWLKALTPDHAYTEYDDGRERYIFRGGPRVGPRGLRLHARMDPAPASPDQNRGERVLYETFLPGLTAREAARPAQATAQAINRAERPYLVSRSNSNWANAENTQASLGRRIGDRQTWGWGPEPPAARPPLR
jgi:hypothetical protein